MGSSLQKDLPIATSLVIRAIWNPIPSSGSSCWSLVTMVKRVVAKQQVIDMSRERMPNIEPSPRMSSKECKRRSILAGLRMLKAPAATCPQKFESNQYQCQSCLHTVTVEGEVKLSHFVHVCKSYNISFPNVQLNLTCLSW